MKKLILVSIIVFLFSFTSNALAICQPEDLPYKIDNNTYNDVICVYDSYFQRTRCTYFNKETVSILTGGIEVSYADARIYVAGSGIYQETKNSACAIYSTISHNTGTYTMLIRASSTLSENFVVTTHSIFALKTENFASKVGLYEVTKDETLMLSNLDSTGPNTLSFPLDKDCSGVPCTPYTAEVSSVMDHSMTTPYTKDGVVLAFNGEEGDVDEGCWCYTTGLACNSGNFTSCTVAGFMKDGGGDFFSGILNFSDSYLYYDGHPGYDYPASLYTDTIISPASGTLCIATSTTQQPYPVDVWRDTTKCPLASIPGGVTWSNYHTFYIIHEGLYINGLTNDYMTAFLHSDDLESSVRDDIEQSGYATVAKSQSIADVGNFPSGGYHVHLEVYKKNGENWDRVDPYGDGANNILWE